VVFDDKTLASLAQRRPRAAAGLQRVRGIGPVKAERYGAEVLRIVSEHTR
jgi:superfamily II DNA helicase RecQ